MEKPDSNCTNMELKLFAPLLNNSHFLILIAPIWNWNINYVWYWWFFAGEHINLLHSFPSGHTITAFAFFMALTFFTKNRLWQVLCFVLALLVGFSRIYLQQHFAIDVLVGSLVGVLVTIGCKYIVDKFPIKWIDNSFFRLLNKWISCWVGKSIFFLENVFDGFVIQN